MVAESPREAGHIIANIRRTRTADAPCQDVRRKRCTPVVGAAADSSCRSAGFVTVWSGESDRLEGVDFEDVDIDGRPRFAMIASQHSAKRWLLIRLDDHRDSVPVSSV